MYAMFQFFFLFGFFAFYKGFENDHKSESINQGRSTGTPLFNSIAIIKKWGLNWKWLIISAFSLYISFLLQKLTVFLGLSIFMYCLVLGMTTLVKGTFRDFLQSKYFFAAISMILAGALILLMSSKLSALADDLIHFLPSWASARSPMPLLYAQFLASTPVFPVGVLFILGSYQIITRATKPGAYILISILIPLLIISLYFSELRSNRYIFNIFALIVIVSSFSLDQFFQSEKKVFYQILETIKFDKYKKICFGLIMATMCLVLSTSFVLYGYRVIIDYYGEEGPLAMEHNDWKAAHHYIVENSKPTDIVIASNPLIATFYNFNHLDYMLFKNKNDYRLFRQKAIPDLQTFQSILRKNPRGWIVTDPDRFYSNVHTEKEVRAYIEKHLTRCKISPRMRLLIFSWDNNDRPGSS